MAARTLPEDQRTVRTHLEDLQSEFEAGARKLTTIADSVAEMRAELLARHLQQAHLAGTLVRRVQELQGCVEQQRERLGELRTAIRDRRR